MDSSVAALKQANVSAHDGGMKTLRHRTFWPCSILNHACLVFKHKHIVLYVERRKESYTAYSVQCCTVYHLVRIKLRKNLWHKNTVNRKKAYLPQSLGQNIKKLLKAILKLYVHTHVFQFYITYVCSSIVSSCCLFQKHDRTQTNKTPPHTMKQ